jgi:hypothetical protein
MDAAHPGLDHPDGGAHHQAQMRHQTGDAHPDASLPQHLSREVQGRFPPGVAIRTPPPVELMLDHRDGRRRRQVHHLPTTAHMDPTQAALTLWAALEVIFHDLSRRLPPSRVVVFGGALLPRLLGALWRIRLHEGRWGRLLRFQLLDACLSGSQGRRQLRHLLLQGTQFAPEGSIFRSQSG